MTTPDPTPPDVLARSRQRTRATAVAASAAVVAVVTWSLWPLSRTTPTLHGSSSASAPAASPDSRIASRGSSSAPLPIAHSPFPPSPFSAPLWVDPPRPSIAQSVVPPTPPPLRLQLVAILTPPDTASDQASSNLRAILYDQGADKLLTVGAGDALGARSIAAVDADGVTLLLPSGTQRLDLRAATPSPRGANTASAASTPRRTTAADDLATLLGRASPPMPGLSSPVAPAPNTQATSTTGAGR